MIKLIDILKEVSHWKPGQKYGNYLIDDDCKDEKTIIQFVEYNNMNPQIIDIWRYAKDNFKVYPVKIFPHAIQYNTKEGKVELEIKKDRIEMYLFVFRSIKDGYKLLGHKSKFDYKTFKEYMTKY